MGVVATCPFRCGSRGCQIPHTYSAGTAGRHEPSALEVKLRAGHRIRMAKQRKGRRAVTHIPHADLSVPKARNELRAVGRKPGNGERRVALQRARQFLTGLGIPEACLCRQAPCHQLVLVRTENQPSHLIRVSRARTCELTVRESNDVGKAIFNYGEAFVGHRDRVSPLCPWKSPVKWHAGNEFARIGIVHDGQIRSVAFHCGHQVAAAGAQPRGINSLAGQVQQRRYRFAVCRVPDLH